MTIKTFQCNMLQENCYVVSDETNEAVIIDCGAYYEAERQAIIDYCEQQGLTLKHHLCTHAHFDHVFGCDTIYEHYGLKPEIHPADGPIYHNIDRFCIDMLGAPYGRTQPPVTSLADGQQIDFGSHTLKVLHTPGHSPGCVFFYCEEEKTAFSGDTLFRMSVGRTDLPFGSWGDMMESMQKVVSKLPADTTVYPGHGPKTTIGEELAMNPYLR